MRRHVQRVRRVGGDLRVAARRLEGVRRKRRHVVAVDDVVRQPGVLRLRLPELLQDCAGFQLIGVRLVGRIRRRRERERVERRGLGVIRVARRKTAHRVPIAQHARALVERIRIVEQRRARSDVVALARRLRAGRLRAGERVAAGLHLRGWPLRDREGVPPLRQTDSPERDAAAGILVGDGLECLNRGAELERVQQRHPSRENGLHVSAC